MLSRGAIGGKTGKTVVLPGFCKIELGGSSDGAACYRGLIWLGGARISGVPLLSPGSYEYNSFSVIFLGTGGGQGDIQEVS